MDLHDYSSVKFAYKDRKKINTNDKKKKNYENQETYLL